MSFFRLTQQPITRCGILSRAPAHAPSIKPSCHNAFLSVWMRCASTSKKSASSQKKATKSTGNSGLPNAQAQIKAGKRDPTTPTAKVQNKAGKRNPTPSFTKPPPRYPSHKMAKAFQAGGQTVEIDEKEELIQRNIIKNRQKILWPGIWTFLAVVGTWGTLAYLDAKYPIFKEKIQEHVQLPQTWYLTPTIVKEGIVSGWNELDKLTIGIVIACVSIHLLKSSPLPLWEKLIHITGEKKFTAFTYPFVHSDWSHLAVNMFVLCWFCPSVVRSFDGDIYHTAALYMSVPLITSYHQHFIFRFGIEAVKTGMPMNMGASGAIAAICGAYVMSNPQEKVWLPMSLVFRLDAQLWGLMYLLLEMLAQIRRPPSPALVARGTHFISFVMGTMYVGFNGKERIWEPLVAWFGKDIEMGTQL